MTCLLTWTLTASRLKEGKQCWLQILNAFSKIWDWNSSGSLALFSSVVIEQHMHWFWRFEYWPCVIDQSSCESSIFLLLRVYWSCWCHRDVMSLCYPRSIASVLSLDTTICFQVCTLWDADCSAMVATKWSWNAAQCPSWKSCKFCDFSMEQLHKWDWNDNINLVCAQIHLLASGFSFLLADIIDDILHQNGIILADQSNFSVDLWGGYQHLEVTKG